MIKRIAFVASWIVAILAVTGIAWALNGSGDTDPGTPAEVAMIDDGTTTTTSQPGSGFVDDGSDDGFVDDDSDDGSVDDDSSTTTSAATAAPFTETYRIGDAGTVTLDFDGSILTILGTSAAEGWYVEIDAATGTEVEAEFSDGTTEFEFEAEFEHGEVRVSIGQTEH